MRVEQELEALRNAVPGCTVVIFGDLFSQITLCVSSSKKIKQEQLDAYCVSAGNLLDGDIANSIANVLGVPDTSSLAHAAVLNPGEVQVFLRSPFEDADVLCCIGSMHCDVSEISAIADQTFARIAQFQ
jgi:hypothetical protein